jgi:hypothetical protein
MISGEHSHCCKHCQTFWPCQRITHCKKPLDSPCLDCEEELLKGLAKEWSDESIQREIDEMANYLDKELFGKNEK